MHTESCQKVIDKITAHNNEYIASYPNHCQKCGGVGGQWYSYDPSPSGVSLGSGSMSDFDSCSECLDKNRCPRCSEKIDWIENPADPLFTEYYLCRSCGWTDHEDAPPPEGLWQYDDCECWENDFREEPDSE